MPVDTRQSKRVSGIGAIVSALWAFVLLVWGTIGTLQQAADIHQNWVWWKRVLTSWPVFAIAFILFALTFAFFRRKLAADVGSLDAVALAEHPPADRLIGRWFHSFEDGEVKYQGRVLSREGKGYMAQLYSFDDGHPTVQIYFREEDLANLRFYSSNDEMQDEWFRRNPELYDWRRHRS